MRQQLITKIEYQPAGLAAGHGSAAGAEELTRARFSQAGARRRTLGFSPAVCAAFALLPIIAAFVALIAGSYAVSPAEALGAIWDKLTGVAVDSQLDRVLFSVRLPRILLAVLVGGGLSVSGTAFQSLFSNPLATPDTLGVASGASFGAVAGLFFGVGLIATQTLALAGGILAVGLTYFVSRGKQRKSGVTVVLAGIIIGSLFTALVSLVKYGADVESQLPSITYWLMGTLSNAGWNTLALGAPFILIGVAAIFMLRWRLNILPLSDDEARATGTNVRALRLLTVLAATLITASCVSMCGQVGWVGLLVPHICRMIFGGDNKRIVPAAISLGAAFMIIVDTLARTMTAAEIPVSILTAIIGAPVFILLLRRTGGFAL